MKRFSATLFACGTLCFAAPESPTDTPPPADAGVVLNHRLNLNEEAKRHATTYLWEGAETYIDVHMANKSTATHNRVGALDRGLPPGLGRLTEDCGVCLSSFFPITPQMHGRNIEVIVLGLAGCDPALKPDVWTTTYPHPYESMEMIIE